MRASPLQSGPEQASGKTNEAEQGGVAKRNGNARILGTRGKNEKLSFLAELVQPAKLKHRKNGSLVEIKQK